MGRVPEFESTGSVWGVSVWGGTCPGHARGAGERAARVGGREVNHWRICHLLAGVRWCGVPQGIAASRAASPAAAPHR